MARKVAARRSPDRAPNAETSAVAAAVPPTTKVAPHQRSKKQQSRWLLADEKRERRIVLLRKGLRIRMENAGVDDVRDLFDADADAAILGAAREVRRPHTSL
jgi:hypothetical protein